jgi:predicted chitinase
MGYYTYQYRGEVQDWINTHIRADDFSTYRRGNAPPPPIGLTARNLSDAMGGAVSLDRYAQLLPGYRAACVEAGLSGNLNRLAMFAAQLGEESGGLKWMEEIASGSEYEGRSDLGNTQPGDGVRFKGRGPIQITGRNNYSQLSQWAFGKGYVPSPTFFVDNPTQLSTDQYGFLGPVWYWTVARPQINSLCDAGDIVGVTKAINGGTNGLQDRTNRWNHCLAMGLAQLDVQGTTGPTPDTGDDDLSAEAERMIKELYDEYRKEKTGPSRSFMVPDGNPVDSPLGFLWNIDGNVENINITLGYLFGTTLAEEFVNTVASTGVAPASWAGNVNRAWLQQYGQQWCLGLIDFRAAIQTALQSAGAVPVVNNAAPTIVTASITPAQAQDIANRIGQQIAIPATPPAATVPAVVDSPAGLGDIVKTVVDAVEQLKLSDALSTQDYATLAASIKILEMKNGTA